MRQIYFFESAPVNSLLLTIGEERDKDATPAMYSREYNNNTIPLRRLDYTASHCALFTLAQVVFLPNSSCRSSIVLRGDLSFMESSWLSSRLTGISTFLGIKPALELHPKKGYLEPFLFLSCQLFLFLQGTENRLSSGQKF